MNAAAKFVEYLPMVVQLVAANMNVKVVFSDSAKTASLDSEMNLVIPAAIGGLSTLEDKAIINGFVAHEAVGHARHTDFKITEKFMKEKGATEIGMRILNIIEDPRIERAAIRIYPGAKNILNELVDTLQKKHPDFFNADPSKPIETNQAILGMILNGLRRDELGQNCDPEPFIKACHEKIGKDLTDKIYAEAIIGNRATSTAGAIESTRAILKLIKDLADEEPPKDEKGGEQPDQSKGEKNPNGDGSPKDSQNQQENPSDQSGDASGAPKKKGKGKDKTPSPNGKPDGASQAAKDALAKPCPGNIGKDLSDLMKDTLKEDIQKSSSSSSNVPYAFKNTKKMTGMNSKLTLSADYRGGAVRVSATLEELLQSKVDEKSVISKAGRLNGSMLAQVRLGNLSVFEREEDEIEGLDTAVYFMIDASGSMSEARRGEMANKAIVISGESLSKFDVPYGVAYFNNSVIEAKQFGENWHTIRGRFNQVIASGGTPITAAIAHAHAKLVGRPESRKVAIIVTDGTFSIDWKSILNTAKNTGVEVRFVVVGYDKSFESTVKQIQLHGGVVAIANKSEEIALTILNSLKQVF